MESEIVYTLKIVIVGGVGVFTAYKLIGTYNWLRRQAEHVHQAHNDPDGDTIFQEELSRYDGDED